MDSESRRGLRLCPAGVAGAKESQSRRALFSRATMCQKIFESLSSGKSEPHRQDTQSDCAARRFDPESPMLEALREALLQLNIYAVAFRYPGESASRENARDARTLCESVRKTLRRHLGCCE